MLGKNLQLTAYTSTQKYNYPLKPTSYHSHRKIAVKPRIRKEALWIDYKDPNQKEDNTPFRFTGKERDLETGLYYYGARYLDPKTSRWMSTDPAMYQGDYLPSAPVNDEAKKRNGNLPGQGGVFNYVNMHVYHYAGNNPVKYTDPDGRKIEIQAHQAVKKYSLGLSPYYHTLIRITLDTNELEAAFKDHELFKDSKKDENGKQFITIGGTRNKDGKLVGIINKKEDVYQKKEGSYIVKGNFKNKFNEVASVEKILEAYTNYEESGYVDYAFFPSKGKGYNSNSYTSGILSYARLQKNRFLPATGWERSIPIPRTRPVEPIMESNE